MRAMLMPNLERVELDGPAASVGQRHEAVVTAFPNATEAGVEILRAGGNAIDAAVGRRLGALRVRTQCIGSGRADRVARPFCG
ncbi:gamma-glutamyltranspeptidase [Bradyrhizobium ottawaense]|uniref:hypothetical protein n=1 Tax=Bradyrhizobium ottawaense TaxID=931866 RepID=UPI003512F4CC